MLSLNQARDRKPVYFTVKGSGVFPLDMLRHDRCFPTDTESALRLGQYDKDREVNLYAEAALSLTPRRWTSFGWKIVGWRQE